MYGKAVVNIFIQILENLSLILQTTGGGIGIKMWWICAQVGGLCTMVWI